MRVVMRSLMLLATYLGDEVLDQAFCWWRRRATARRRRSAAAPARRAISARSSSRRPAGGGDDVGVGLGLQVGDLGVEAGPPVGEQRLGLRVGLGEQALALAVDVAERLADRGRLAFGVGLAPADSSSSSWTLRGAILRSAFLAIGPTFQTSRPMTMTDARLP